MRDARGILQALAQHHVAAALAVHRPRLARKSRRPSRKRRACGEAPGMELGVAAGQPAGVAIGRRRLVGERRERHEFGPRRPPARRHVRIQEREGRIRRDGDALARRAGQGARAPERAPHRPRRPGSRRGRGRPRRGRASRSRRASRSSVSRAWTRPRWRSGRTRLASRISAPSTGMPMRRSPASTRRRWRALATLFRTTPAMRMRGS